MRNIDMEQLTFEYITRPTLEFSVLAQRLGYLAWRERFTQRSDTELQKMFTPYDPESTMQARKALSRMETKAVDGTFSGVTARLNGVPVGFAWGTDDRAVSPQQSPIDSKAEPYAWIAHINVLPSLHHLGIGRGILKNVLSGFTDTQKPTAYIFDENQPTLEMFQRLGFRKSPDEPRIKDDYFGPENAPVRQWRLEAASVGAVVTSLA